jgi:DNA uptake protein ComE-like DNA-binding protein
MDLNSATKEQLEAAPEIGAAYSQKIIDGRPYAKVSDLAKKNIVPPDAYAKIKDVVTVAPK